MSLDLDYQALKFWVDLAQATFTLGLGVYVYITSRERATNERVRVVEEKTDKRLDDHESRLSKVEAACTSAPNHQDLGGVYERVNSVDGKVNEIAGQLKVIGRAVDMINQHLLEHKR